MYHVASFTWTNLKRSETKLAVHILARGVWDSSALQFCLTEQIIMVAGWDTGNGEDQKLWALLLAKGAASPEVMSLPETTSIHSHCGDTKAKPLASFGDNFEGLYHPQGVHLAAPSAYPAPSVPYGCSQEHCHLSFLHTSSISTSYYGTQPTKSKPLETVAWEYMLS